MQLRKKSQYYEIKRLQFHKFLHYIAKIIGSPPSNERFDYFSNFHVYKS